MTPEKNEMNVIRMEDGFSDGYEENNGDFTFTYFDAEEPKAEDRSEVVRDNAALSLEKMAALLNEMKNDETPEEAHHE